MGQGRGQDGCPHPGPGAHVCPPRRLPGGKDVMEKERMSNVSQSLTVRVALQKTRSKSNSTILLISKDSVTPADQRPHDREEHVPYDPGHLPHPRVLLPDSESFE